jgi:hypothetical protein
MGNKSQECRVCFAPHDEEIHSATLRVREWLRGQVKTWLQPGDEVPDGPGAGEVTRDAA